MFWYGFQGFHDFWFKLPNEEIVLFSQRTRDYVQRIMLGLSRNNLFVHTISNVFNLMLFWLCLSKKVKVGRKFFYDFHSIFPNVHCHKQIINYNSYAALYDCGAYHSWFVGLFSNWVFEFQKYKLLCLNQFGSIFNFILNFWRIYVIIFYLTSPHKNLSKKINVVVRYWTCKAEDADTEQKFQVKKNLNWMMDTVIKLLRRSAARVN